MLEGTEQRDWRSTFLLLIFLRWDEGSRLVLIASGISVSCLHKVHYEVGKVKYILSKINITNSIAPDSWLKRYYHFRNDMMSVLLLAFNLFHWMTFLIHKGHLQTLTYLLFFYILKISVMLERGTLFQKWFLPHVHIAINMWSNKVAGLWLRGGEVCPWQFVLSLACRKCRTGQVFIVIHEDTIWQRRHDYESIISRRCEPC